MNLILNSKGNTPYYLQLRNQLRRMIFSGQIPGGMSLPSEREVARMVGIHRNTVARAYQELKSEGLIQAVHGHCFQVVREEAPISLVDGDRRRQFCWEALTREPYQSPRSPFDRLMVESMDSQWISFAAGYPSQEMYPKRMIGSLLKNLAETESGDVFDYSHPAGISALRENLRHHLANRGIVASTAEIHVISEVSQALNWIIKLFVRPGESVILEEPVCVDVYLSFLEAGAHIVTVPTDLDGMQTDRLEGLIQRHHPKLIYVMPTFNNPTERVMSMARRLVLLELATQYNIAVVEDDAVYDLRYDGESIPPLRALDTGGNVIYLDSFAHGIAPGLRVGYAVAPPFVIDAFSRLIVRESVHVDSISQLVTSHFLEAGLYSQRMEALKNHYRKKRDLMLSCLSPGRSLGLSYECPDGGVGIWCRLPDQVCSNDLLRAARKRGVLFVPGEVFYPRGTAGDSWMRLNYTHPSEERIRSGIPLLLDAVRECLGL